MARTTFMTLPAELRDRIYEYAVLPHTTRCIKAVWDKNSNTLEFKATASALTSVCRLIHNDYEDVARKAITTLEFTAIDMDFAPIMDYFDRCVDAKQLGYLQHNKATIHVSVTCPSKRYEFPMAKFYTWALFLVNMRLEATYSSDPYTWMWIHESSPDPQWREQCEDENDIKPDPVRDHIYEIGKIAEAFEKNIWRNYYLFTREMQVQRHLRNGDQYRRMAP